MEADQVVRSLMPEFLVLSFGLSFLISKEVNVIRKCFEMKKAVEKKEGN